VVAETVVFLRQGFLGHEVPHQIEDGAAEHGVALLDRLVADGEGGVGLAGAGWAQEDRPRGFTDELAGGELIDVLAGNLRVKMPVKAVESFEAVKACGAGSQGDLVLLAQVHLVLQEDFEELSMAEAIAGGFLESDVEGGGQNGEPELFERRDKLGM